MNEKSESNWPARTACALVLLNATFVAAAIFHAPIAKGTLGLMIVVTTAAMIAISIWQREAVDA